MASERPPVCGANVGFAEISLMPQPPLLTRRGILPNGVGVCNEVEDLFHREKQYSFGFAPLRSSLPECACGASHHAWCEVSFFNHVLRLVLMCCDVQRMARRFVTGFGRDSSFHTGFGLLLHSALSESGPYARRIDPSHCVCRRVALYHVSQ